MPDLTYFESVLNSVYKDIESKVQRKVLKKDLRYL